MRACDKTISIIPTVLISNAIKYSPPETEIFVGLRLEKDDVVLEVTNFLREGTVLDNSIFERGVRASTDSDGTGNGLYVAQLVAKQHGTIIALKVNDEPYGKTSCTFSVRLKTDPGI